MAEIIARFADGRLIQEGTANSPVRSGKHWTPEELEYLSDNYGLTPDKLLAHNLKRTERAIQNMAERRLGQRRRDNFYTARELTRLGIGDSKQVVRWRQWGWLQGKKSFVRNNHHMWQFTEEAVIDCLRQRPWLVDLASMPRHYFRSIVREEWERDPWYTSEQTAPLLGVKPDTVLRYIRRGWLQAEKKLCEEHPWIIRHSAIQAFLENDPRPQHEKAARSAGQHQRSFNADKPAMLAQIWLYKCPACGEMVKLTAPVKLRALQIKELFRTIYVDGQCSHGKAVELETD